MNKYIRFVVAVFYIGLFSQICIAGEPAPEFKLPSPNGIVDLSSLHGQVVYLDFWASWCGPCRKSFPWMNEMHKKYSQQGLKIVAVNLDKDRDAIDKFLAENKAEFTIAFDPAGNVAKRYRLVGMPSSFIIDRTGQIRESHIGFRSSEMEKMESAIKSVLSM